MKLAIIVLTGGLMLSPTLNAKEQVKKPVNPNQDYSIAFNNAFSAATKALVEYAHTDCTAPEFNGTVEAFKDSMHTLSTLITNMPDSLDDEAKYTFTEEAYGVLYLSNGIVDAQNKCVDDHNGSDDNKGKIFLKQGN
jgi:hypothetical protein